MLCRLISVSMDSLNGHVRMGVGFARIRLACESMRIANPHHRCTVPTPRRKRLRYSDSHNINKACESLSDSRESAWLANPCELRIRITDVLCPHHVGSVYGVATRTTSRRLVNHSRIRANPLGLRIHANCESASQVYLHLTGSLDGRAAVCRPRGCQIDPH